MSHSTNRAELPRRDILKLAGLSALAAMSGACQKPHLVEPVARARSLRLIHFTDIHIQPDDNAGEWTARAFEHVRRTAPDAELIVTGGDLVFDSLDADEGRVKTLWDLWQKTCRDHCGLPLVHTMGNHDVWGWRKSKSKTTGREARWGKQWWCEAIGQDRTYTSFDRADWHIVLLDSIQPIDDGYEGGIDAAQMDWLARDLAAVGARRKTLVVTHIPVLIQDVAANARLVDGKVEGELKISRGLSLSDAKNVIELFAKHSHVKAQLSGHVHITERQRFGGVDYLCSGAVCGSWWKKPDPKTKLPRSNPGYNIIDLYTDGSVETTYVEYGWMPA